MKHSPEIHQTESPRARAEPSRIPGFLRSGIRLAAVLALAGCGASGLNNPGGQTGGVHEKIFQGSLDADTSPDTWWRLKVAQPVTLDQLREMMDQGYSFSVHTKSASGGGSGETAFDCLETDISDGDQLFLCAGPKISPTGRLEDEYWTGANLGFRKGDTYYVDRGNQPDPSGDFGISLFRE